MGTVFQQLSILYLFLVAGWVLGRRRKDKASHGDLLSILIVNIFLPCKVFSTFANNISIAYVSEKYTLLIASVILLTALVGVSLIVSRLITRKPYERRVYAYSVPISNYAYLGYALIGSVFGEGVLAEFMFFAIPFILYTYTVGYVLLTGGKNPAKRLLNPITGAILLGIIVGLSGIPMPSVVTSSLSMASSCVGPISMILTGITLSTFTLRELLADARAYVFSLIRLVAIPALAYFLCRAAHLDGILPMVLIITCMPCGLNPIVFPRLIGEDYKPGARLALITHVFSLATLPFWLSLIL